jgi:hypothetical protein
MNSECSLTRYFHVAAAAAASENESMPADARDLRRDLRRDTDPIPRLFPQEECQPEMA